jgi:hypothetical protein
MDAKPSRRLSHNLSFDLANVVPKERLDVGRIIEELETEHSWQRHHSTEYAIP